MDPRGRQTCRTGANHPRSPRGTLGPLPGRGPPRRAFSPGLPHPLAPPPRSPLGAERVPGPRPGPFDPDSGGPPPARPGPHLPRGGGVARGEASIGPRVPGREPLPETGPGCAGFLGASTGPVPSAWTSLGLSVSVAVEGASRAAKGARRPGRGRTRPGVSAGRGGRRESRAGCTRHGVPSGRVSICGSAQDETGTPALGPALNTDGLGAGFLLT